MQIAAVSRNPNQLDLFLCGTNGRVYTSSWSDESPWSGLNGWEEIGGPVPVWPTTVEVAAVSRNPNQLDLFMCGGNGHVYTSSWTAGSNWSGLNGWEDIGGTFPQGAPVTAVSRNPNQLDLFICGNNGHVYTSSWTNGSNWSGLNGWKDIGGTFPVGAPVTAVSRNPNQLDLFICGNNGHVYTSWWTNGSNWSGLNGWEDIGGTFATTASVAAVSRNPNQLDLFICGDDGHVYTSWWTAGSNWSGLNGWKDIGGTFPAAAPVTAVSRNPNQLDLFVCAMDGLVYTSWWTNGSNWSGLNGWEVIGGTFPAAAPVAAVSRNPNQLDLFVCRDNDINGYVYTSWWTAGSNWSGLTFWDNISSWSSGNNAVFTNQCRALGDVTVTLDVTEDLTTADDKGFSLQLNAYPMPGVNVMGLPLNWLQYVIYVSNVYGNNTAAYQWQAWSIGSTQWPEGDPSVPANANQPAVGIVQPQNNVITKVPSNRLPKGSTLTIALTTDPSSHGITAMKFSVGLPGAQEESITVDFPASVPFTFASGKPSSSYNAQFPISGFQVNIVGPGNDSQTMFSSGTGVLNYSVPAGGTLDVQPGYVGTACGQYAGSLTGESSNIEYASFVTPPIASPGGAWLSRDQQFGLPWPGNNFAP